MDSLGKLLLGFGLALIVAGIVVLLLAHFGARRLPGDIVIHRGNFTLYLPFGLMILLSLLLTLLLNLFDRK
jgi:Protein of unknown function (DUF2905)